MWLVFQISADAIAKRPVDHKPVQDKWPVLLGGTIPFAARFPDPKIKELEYGFMIWKWPQLGGLS